MTNDTEDGHSDYSAEQLRAIWFAVFSVEFTMIFIINAVSIIAFTRNRHLRKPSTYLIINLIVSDLLVGAVTGLLNIYYGVIASHLGCSLVQMIIDIFAGVFTISSVVNLSFIALERLHATLNPFRHCLIEKWFYFKIIIFSWLLALILASVYAVLNYILCTPEAIAISDWLRTSVTVLTLLLVTACNVIITVNIKRNPPPHPSSAVASERKLSVTLFIVSIVSMLTILPWVVYNGLTTQPAVRLSKATEFHFVSLVRFLFHMNSIVSPVIYAIRLQEFRKAVRELICKNYSAPTSVEPIELHEM